MAAEPPAGPPPGNEESPEDLKKAINMLDGLKVTPKGPDAMQIKKPLGRLIGKGTFGAVYQAVLPETNETVAIKVVHQDKAYKNRELDVMKSLAHVNIVALRKYHTVTDEQTQNLYLHMIMEYMPNTLYDLIRHARKQHRRLPSMDIKLYTYQMFRAVAYIHSLGICHRDIKPENLLIDPVARTLKLCDFGSAKQLSPGEASINYICSRYYRAPELLFGCTEYTTSVDIWSVGCVVAEMLLRKPLFPADCNVSLLVDIIKVLGTPTREQVLAMNRDYQVFSFPTVPAKAWGEVIPGAPQEAVDLLGALLVYEPATRLNLFRALAHPFFTDLTRRETVVLNGGTLPPLFNWTEAEISLYPDITSQLTAASEAQ